MIERQRTAHPFRAIRFLIAAILAACVWCTGGSVRCRAAEPASGGAAWILVTVDGPVHARDVRLTGNGKGFDVTGVSGEKGAVPLDACIGLMRRTGTSPRYPRAYDTRVMVELLSGETVFATGPACGKDALTVTHPVWGALSFPLGSVRRICMKPGNGTAAPDPSFTGVRFANGDEIAGRVASIVGETILVEIEEVGKLPVEGFETVGDIVLSPLAPPEDRPPGDSRAVSILCRGGDRIEGSIEAAKEGAWIVRVKWHKELLRITSTRIASVSFTGAHVSLSGLEPSKAEMTPFVGAVLPWKANASIDGGIMEVGGYRALEGLSMHSRTILAFPLAAHSKKPLRFRCLLGIDSKIVSGTGDAEFSVAADGTVVQRKRVVSGAAPAPLSADIPAGTSTLTITVDYGRGGSSGDIVDIMWPSLVIVKEPPPAPEPPPVPEDVPEEAPSEKK